VLDKIAEDTLAVMRTVETMVVEMFLLLVVVEMETEEYPTEVHTIVAVEIAVAMEDSAQIALVDPVAANCIA